MASEDLQLISEIDFPWKKVESLSQRILDNDDSFPTSETFTIVALDLDAVIVFVSDGRIFTSCTWWHVSVDVWFVSFTDPKCIKLLQEYHRGRPALAEKIQHLKLIRKKESDNGEILFQVIVGTSSTAPSDLPDGYSIPESCSVPSSPSLTRVQMQEKNKLWPTVFSPHLLPAEHRISQRELDDMVLGMKMALEEASLAASLGELPIAACILPDSYLDEPLLAHDTRVSTCHPLRHTVMNLVRALADRVLKASDPPQTSTLRPLMPTSAERIPTPTLQNGEGYHLTNRTLFITHEPCLMCTMALVHSRVKEVIYLYPMSETGGCGGQTVVPQLPTINHRFNIWCWKEQRLTDFFDEKEQEALKSIILESSTDA
ncbi:hypothetical protein FRC17_002202 [Serendipita sp. 399]|nr:hypothetical protein FRC17_002202 [Serendipita sp. 399]